MVIKKIPPDSTSKIIAHKSMMSFLILCKILRNFPFLSSFEKFSSS